MDQIFYFQIVFGFYNLVLLLYAVDLDRWPRANVLLYLAAVSLYDGPSFFLSTEWHLLQLLLLASASAAATSREPHLASKEKNSMPMSRDCTRPSGIRGRSMYRFLGCVCYRGS